MRFGRPHQLGRLRARHPLFTQATQYDVWPFDERSGDYARNRSDKPLVGDLDLNANSIGWKWDHPDVTSGYVNLGDSTNFFNTSEATFFVLFRRLADSTTQTFFSTRKGGTYCFMPQFNANNRMVAVYRDSGDSRQDMLGSWAHANGQWHTVLVSARDGQIYLAQDGRITNSAADFSSQETLDELSTADAMLFSRNAATDDFKGLVALAVISDAFVTPDIGARVSGTPWSLFEGGKRRRLWAVPISVLVGADPLAGAGALLGDPVVGVSRPGTLSAAGTLSGTSELSVSRIADALLASGSVTAGYLLAVSRPGSGIEAAGSLSGAAQLSVSQAADTLVAVASMSGEPTISVSQIAAALQSQGALSGAPEISVLMVASAVAASGVFSGGARIGVSTPADPLAAAGSVAGEQQNSVFAAASPLELAGGLAGQPVIAVDIATGLIQAGGSVLGTSVLSVLKSADALQAAGDMAGSGNVSASVSADALQAAATVEGGNVVAVLASADPLAATAAVVGGHVISATVSATALSALGEVLGGARISVNVVADELTASGSLAGYHGLALPAGPIAADGNVAGNFVSSRLISADALNAGGELSAGAVLSVLRAADALMAQGLLYGAVAVSASSLDDVSGAKAGLLDEGRRAALVDEQTGAWLLNIEFKATLH